MPPTSRNQKDLPHKAKSAAARVTDPNSDALVKLEPDELAKLFDAPLEIGYALAPAGKSLPAAFVADRRARLSGRSELTLTEAAIVVGVCRDTVYRWRSWKELNGRYAVIGGKRVVVVTIEELARRLKAAGWTVPVRETPSQFEKRGQREQAALKKRLWGEV